MGPLVGPLVGLLATEKTVRRTIRGRNTIVAGVNTASHPVLRPHIGMVAIVVQAALAYKVDRQVARKSLILESCVFSVVFDSVQ